MNSCLPFSTQFCCSQSLPYLDKCLLSSIHVGAWAKKDLGIVLYQRRQWHPTPVLLLGKSHGQRSLLGYSPWGRKESEITEQLHVHISILIYCFGLNVIREGYLDKTFYIIVPTVLLLFLILWPLTNMGIL